MKIIRNNIIPIKGFKAINLFGILFVRENAHIDKTTLNHEAIHTAQMKELLYVFFYLLYLVEWLIKLFRYKNNNEAYRNISFEREAYENQIDLGYLKTRKRFAFINFLKRKIMIRKERNKDQYTVFSESGKKNGNVQKTGQKLKKIEAGRIL